MFDAVDVCLLRVLVCLFLFVRLTSSWVNSLIVAFISLVCSFVCFVHTFVYLVVHSFWLVCSLVSLVRSFVSLGSLFIHCMILSFGWLVRSFAWFVVRLSTSVICIYAFFAHRYFAVIRILGIYMIFFTLSSLRWNIAYFKVLLKILL